MSEAFERRCLELDDLADQFAKAEADRCYLEEFKKSKLAILMKEFESKYPAVSAQEREARAHPEYLQLLDGLRVATEIAERARYRLKNFYTNASIWQTRNANERAKLKLI